MKEQKTLRRKIAEKLIFNPEVLDKKPCDLDSESALERKDALSMADAIIKQVKREVTRSY